MNKHLKAAFAVTALAAAFVSAPSFALTPADLMGEHAEGMAPARTIQLGDKTRWINVEYGEAVQFVSNGKTFTWVFSGVGNNMKLSQIAPSDFGAPDVMIYVNQATNPLNATDEGGE